jgi:hypothetical protein
LVTALDLGVPPLSLLALVAMVSLGITGRGGMMRGIAGLVVLLIIRLGLLATTLMFA